MQSKIELFKLAPKYQISRVLKGGWQLAGGHGAIEKQSAIDDMFAFVRAGVTTFDCADIYTGVEELIGEFLRQYSKKYSAKETEKIHIHTKFVPDLTLLPQITKKDVETIIDRSLKRLGLEQLHLVQFHWWDYDVPRYVETANYLKELQAKGKIRFVSVTNFDVTHLREIIESGVKLTTHQVQYSVLDHRPEHGMVDFCRKHNIKLLCYGTVAGGFLSEKYLGIAEPKEPLENRSLTKYKLIIDDFGGWDLFQELLQALKKIAEKHHAEIAQVASRYVLEKPEVAGVIVGARNASHVSAVANMFQFVFEQEDIAALEKVMNQAKGPVDDIYNLERLKGGKHAGIMKYNLNKE